MDPVERLVQWVNKHSQLSDGPCAALTSLSPLQFAHAVHTRAFAEHVLVGLKQVANAGATVVRDAPLADYLLHEQRSRTHGLLGLRQPGRFNSLFSRSNALQKSSVKRINSQLQSLADVLDRPWLIPLHVNEVVASHVKQSKNREAFPETPPLCVDGNVDLDLLRAGGRVGSQPRHPSPPPKRKKIMRFLEDDVVSVLEPTRLLDDRREWGLTEEPVANYDEVAFDTKLRLKLKDLKAKETIDNDPANDICPEYQLLCSPWGRAVYDTLNLFDCRDPQEEVELVKFLARTPLHPRLESPEISPVSKVPDESLPSSALVPSESESEFS